MSEHPRDQALEALRRGEPAAALPLFRLALAADETDVAALKGYCQAARVLHLWTELVDALGRLVPIAHTRNDVVDAHLARARLYDEQLGDVRSARAEYEQVLLVDPSQVFPYLALAELDLRAGTWSRAIAHADHGLEFCPTDRVERPLFWICKAVALSRVNQSMGPVSTFFRNLRGGEPIDDDPSALALRTAAARLPALQQRSAEEWLDDQDALMAMVNERLPRPPLPTWWFPDG